MTFDWFVLFFFVFSVLIYLYLDFHPTILYFFLYRLASGSCTFDAFAAWAIQLPTHPAAHYPPNHLKTSWISFFFFLITFSITYTVSILFVGYFVVGLGTKFVSRMCVSLMQANQFFFFFVFLPFGAITTFSRARRNIFSRQLQVQRWRLLISDCEERNTKRSEIIHCLSFSIFLFLSMRFTIWFANDCLTHTQKQNKQ